MTITITEKEYEAILEVLDQVRTDFEAANDKEYLERTEEIMGEVNKVIDKYRRARMKANYFQSVRAEVARYYSNRMLRPRDIDKLTRKLIKKMEDEKKVKQ